MYVWGIVEFYKKVKAIKKLDYLKYTYLINYYIFGSIFLAKKYLRGLIAS